LICLQKIKSRLSAAVYGIAFVCSFRQFTVNQDLKEKTATITFL